MPSARRDLFLENHPFYEEVNPKVVLWLIQHGRQMLSKKWDKSTGEEIRRSPSELDQLIKQLNGYYVRLDRGKQAFRVRYRRSDKCSNYGRVFPVGSFGCTSFPRDVRALLLRGHYRDYDMVAAQMRLYVVICKDEGIPCNALEDYVNTRETWHREIAEYYGVSEALVKKMVIAMSFYGHPHSLLSDQQREQLHRAPNEGMNNRILGLRRQMQQMCQSYRDKHPNQYNTLRAHC
jgi:hypothetical protein